MRQFSNQKLKEIWVYHYGYNNFVSDDGCGRPIIFTQHGEFNKEFYRKNSHGWTLHHKDGNRNNNNIDNLIPIHWKSHKDIHNL